MARIVIFNALNEHSSPAIVPAPSVAGPALPAVGIPAAGLQLPGSVQEMLRNFGRAKGRDNYSVPVPAGLKFDGATVITGPQSSKTAAARVWTITGNGPYKITVAWSAPPGGMVQYRLRAYGIPIIDPATGASEPRENHSLTIVDKQSVERLRNHLRSNDRVKVTFRGADAGALIVAGVLDIFESGEIFVGNVVGIDDLLIICAAIVAGVALAALTVICVVGIANGYTVDVTNASLGSLVPPEFPNFTFELVPPN